MKIRSLRAPLLVVLSLASLHAHAFERPGAGELGPSTLALPSGPGSVRGLAEDPVVEVFSGQVQYRVPIDVPAQEMAFGYDRSRLQESGEVLLSAVFRVTPGEPANFSGTPSD